MDFPDDDDLLPSDSFDALLAGGSPLDALGADLVPPSPILTPSQVAFSWSCESIPVILYDEAYAAVDAESDGVSSISLPRRPPAMHAGAVNPESDDDTDRDDGNEHEYIPGTEYADVFVETVDSPGSGTGPGPSSPRRVSCNVFEQQTPAVGPASGAVFDTFARPCGDINSRRISAIDPVAYQEWRISAATGGLQFESERKDNKCRESESALYKADGAFVCTPTAQPITQDNSSRASGLRTQASRPTDIPNMNEVSRWSADSDSVFLSDSASHLSESVSAQNEGSEALRLNSVNPSIVINSGLSSGSIDVENFPEDDEDQDSAFQTPTKASLRPAVSWISSRSWDYGRYQAYVAREEPSRHALISNSLESYIEYRSVPQPHFTPPNKRTTLGKRDINVLNIDTPRIGRVGTAPVTAISATATMGRDQDHHAHAKAETRTASPRGHSPLPVFRAHAPEVPDYSWLADVCVQFLIDQEGFRAAEPKFWYSGTARVRIGQNSGSRNSGNTPPVVETVQMAQFRMAKRELYHFHHAPFETPPILRRVTINGDETHDYVSKQALLTLKANGVYVLHGQEALVPGHGHGQSDETTKLHWKLEYLVDDRLIDVSQRIMDGEKVLTLLTFSCSPALLLPSQAKKNTLMHVFKKSVAPKLIAEKLQPPGMGVGPGVVGGSSGHSIGNGNGVITRVAAASIPKSAAVSEGHGQAPDTITSSQTHGYITHPRAKTYGWAGLHRRGQSHSIHHATMHSNLAQKIAVGGQVSIRHRTSPSHSHAQYAAATHQDLQHDLSPLRDGHTGDHRRRNSSAGERPSLGEPAMVNAPFTMVSSSRHHWEPTNSPPLDSAGVSPTRHILPPEQLTKLLDSIAVSDDAKRVELEKEHIDLNAKSRPSVGTLSSTITGRMNSTIAGARASMGFAPLPAPPRHRHHQLLKSAPKDIPPV